MLRLSDAFEKKVSSPELEVTLTMLNINPGNHRKLMKKYRTLREYCLFMECIRKDMLADFLSAQRTEVIAMSIFAYNEEEEMKKTVPMNSVQAGKPRKRKAEWRVKGKADWKSKRSLY